MFGAGKCNHAVARGREPVIATDVFELSNQYVDKYREIFTNPRSKGMLKGRRILIASTDVHEHAIMIIHRLLAEAGADMINLGAEVNPDEIVLEAHAKNAEAILISTHNGMALDYAKRLKEELDKHSVRIPVVLGGVLNQKVEDQPLPIDVSADLKKLDFYPCPRLEGRFRKLLESGVISKDFNK
jgi:methylmalonyl-CoA mutase cobalamin-binding subunit